MEVSKRHPVLDCGDDIRSTHLRQSGTLTLQSGIQIAYEVFGQGGVQPKEVNLDVGAGTDPVPSTSGSGDKMVMIMGR